MQIIARNLSLIFFRAQYRGPSPIHTSNQHNRRNSLDSIQENLCFYKVLDIDPVVSRSSAGHAPDTCSLHKLPIPAYPANACTLNIPDWMSIRHFIVQVQISILNTTSVKSGDLRLVWPTQHSKARLTRHSFTFQLSGCFLQPHNVCRFSFSERSKLWLCNT